MRNSFKTSSTYRAARKQQKTANRKTFYDEMNYMISPSEWADGVISGFIDPKTSWLKENLRELPRVVIGLRRDIRSTLVNQGMFLSKSLKRKLLR